MNGRCRRATAGALCSLFVIAAVAVTSLAESGQFYEKDGVAIDGFDPVAYFEDHQAVKGLPTLSHVYKGSTFRFASPGISPSFARRPSGSRPNSEVFAPTAWQKGSRPPSRAKSGRSLKESCISTTTPRCR